MGSIDEHKILDTGTIRVRRWRRRLVFGGAVSALIAGTLVTGFAVTPATAAVASELAFTSGPVNAPSTSSGQNIAVSVESSSGAVITSDTGRSVALVISTNPGGGTLSCSGGETASDVNGVATFTDCIINAVGNGYRLTATASGLTSAVSGTFNVAGSAKLLAFSSGPVNAPSTTSGQTIVVSVEDASGNLTNDSGRNVTLAVSTGSGSISCSGGNTVVDSNGVATFTGCVISAVGNGYRLTATASGLTSAVSGTFNVAGSAKLLAFTSGPVSAATGAGQTIVVSVEDSSGNLTADSGRTVTLAIETNPGGGVLTCSGGNTVVDSNGVATFTGCAISAPGTGYTLIATASGLTSAVSGGFNITGAASMLVFTSGPLSEPATTSTQTIVVSVEDSHGDVVTSDSGRVVTLAIETNPGGGLLTCTGGETATDSHGVATFTGCVISAAGAGYTLVATAAGLTSGLSGAFNIGTTSLPTQIYGPDAIGTSIAISEQEFPVNGSAGGVVLCRSDFYTDCLVGGPLAADINGPLLITPGASESIAIDPRVDAEIERVLPVGGPVYILGGVLALSPNIDATLGGQGYNVIREAGINEYATAVDVAEAEGNPSTIFEATGLSFYDALSAVPAAIKAHAAILLTDGSRETLETYVYLLSVPGDIRYAIGGPEAAAGADPYANAIYGQDLFGTSAAVASTFFPGASMYGVATAADFADALGGGVFMATGGRSGPLLLVNSNAPLPAAILPYLASLAVGAQGYVFGGPLAVAASVLGALQSAVG